jgi:hypothetical protein
MSTKAVVVVVEMVVIIDNQEGGGGGFVPECAGQWPPFFLGIVFNYLKFNGIHIA